jgi:hypothetical protein
MRVVSKRNWADVFLAFAVVIGIFLDGNTGFAATQLGNGVPVTNLSGSEDSVQEFEITVPENTKLLRIESYGGTGDCDLFALSPNYEYFYSDADGSNEMIVIGYPNTGKWYIDLEGYEDYSSVSLIATYYPDFSSIPMRLENGVPITNLSGSAVGTKEFLLTIPPNAGHLRLDTYGGTGDVDLHIYSPKQNFTSTNDFNDESISVDEPEHGEWLVVLWGWENYSGVTLVANVYVCDSSHLHQCTSPSDCASAGGKWVAGTCITRPAIIRTTSAHTCDGAHHVFAHGSDNHLLESWWTWDDGWNISDLTAIPWGVEISDAPSSFADNGVHHVFARGVDGHLYDWWWTWDDGWNISDLTAIPWGAEISDVPSSFTADGVHHVFARGVDGHLYDWWWTWNDGWNISDLTAIPWGVEISDAPSSFADNGVHHVFARGVDGHLYDWWWTWNDGWNISDLTAIPWGKEILDVPSSFTDDGVHHVFACGVDGHLYEWWWTWNDGWNISVLIENLCQKDPDYDDNDGDGYSENQGDCNDNDQNIHPNATEICGDGIDQDCNGGDLPCLNLECESIAGTWIVNYSEVYCDGENYTDNGSLVIKSDCSFTTDLGISGTLAFSNNTFSTSFPDPYYECGTVTYNGTVNGSQISGQYYYQYGGSGTFSGSKEN